MKRLILKQLLKTAQPIIRTMPIEKQRSGQTEILRHKRISNTMQFVHDAHAGFEAEWVVPENIASDYAILYIHGGGYGMGDLLSSRALIAPIAERLKMPAFSFEYRLAPESVYPAALNDCCAAYAYMLEKGFAHDKIVFLGDSAGGGLAVATVLKTKKRLGSPCCVVTISPWADLTETNPSYMLNGADDPMLSAECLKVLADAYIGDDSPLNPLISPAFAKYDKDFPPTLIQVGTHEVLYDDAVVLNENMQKSGVKTELQVYEGMWHVFHIWNLRQSSQAIGDIAAFVDKCRESAQNKH